MASSKAKVAVGLGIIFLELSALPFALICLSRSTPSPNTAIHPILDMAKQPKFTAQRENPMYADRRAERPRITGTLARQDMVLDYTVNHPLDATPAVDIVSDNGIVNGPEHDAILFGQEKDENGKPQFVKNIPIPVTAEFIKHGQQRFNIYCTPCHGYSGYGDGMVARTAADLRAAPPVDNTDAALHWVNPSSYHDPKIRAQPDGEIFNTITNGKSTMPRYDSQIPVMDRWAIVAYVRALQRSQNAQEADIPPEHQADYTK